MSDDSSTPPSQQDPQQEGWAAAVSGFVTARLDLIKLEARDASEVAAKRGVLLAVILGCAFFVWLLGVAGIVGWISDSQSWPWYAVTLAAAGLHLLVAIIAVVLLKKPAPPSFPLTRAELSKDQAWLETLKKDPTSPN
ncbi:phage holin family protein [Haloferula sp.]|uniref:phage holin family protein n=1 Tax=Haloferula sp. TaxID=2497595 RepID=UPI0032A05047